MPTPVVLRVILFLIISDFFTNASGQILDYSTYVKIENGKKVTLKSFKIKVNNSDSRWLSSISIEHASSDVFKLKEAYITDKTGSVVRKVKNKDIKTRNDLSHSTFYQDNVIEEFDMYWNSFPYIIDYSYEITQSDYIFLANWRPAVYLNTTVINSNLEVELTEEYNIHVENEELLQFSETNFNDKKIVRWNCENYTPPSKELQMPSIYELMPMVYVGNNNFHYAIDGSCKTWEDFSRWIHELNEGAYELTLEEKNRINSLLSEDSDPLEKIKRLYHYLQDNTTYINVAIDFGGLKSYPASYVCKNKYGDCKALTTYMKSLLKYVGIESEYTIINAGENESKVNINYPGQQFNHVILYIPLENDTVWLENTSSILPFNYLGTFTQNRYGLPAKEKGGHLIKTPALTAKDNSIVSHYNITSNSNGKGTFEVNKILRGDLFEDFCSLNKNYSKQEISSELADLFQFKKSKIDDWSLTQPHRDSTFISLHVKGEHEDLFRNIGNYKVLTPIQYEFPNYEKPEERTLPLRINLPLMIIDSINYQFEEVNSNIQLPDNISLESTFGHYKVNYFLENDFIKIVNNILINTGEYSNEEYRQYYDFIQDIKNSQKKSSIILTNKHEN